MATPTDIRLGQEIAVGRLGGGGGSYQEYRNTSAFAAVKADGSVVTWGDPNSGGDSSGVNVSSDVSEVFSSTRAFAALKNDGSVVTWGDSNYGGDSTAVAFELSEGVVKLFSSDRAFTALKEDGSVVTWGRQVFYWADPENRNTAIDTQNIDFSSGVRDIYTSGSGFSAVTNDGFVRTWGSSAFYHRAIGSVDFSSGIKSVISNGAANAAIKNDGSVVRWGDRGFGGNFQQEVNLPTNAREIAATQYAFAVLGEDGSVTTWGGGPIYGGLISDVKPFGPVASFSSYGFGDDSSAVAEQLNSGVQRLYSTPGAFAALKEDGSVVTWGNGGGGDSSGVDLSSGVKEIFSNGNRNFLVERVTFDRFVGEAFAALKEDGSVVTWGDAIAGGDSSAVSAALASDVSTIFSTESAFAALKKDGSVVTWGDPSRGGDSSAVASQLASGVVQLIANSYAFIAIKADGSIITWGNPGGGGDSSAVTSQLVSGVVSIASPFDADFNAISEFDENIAAGSTIASFRTTDSDIDDSFTYSFVSGSNDNGAFTIDSDQLIINSSPDYETQSSYSLQIRTTDQSGEFFDKLFNLSVNDLDEDNAAPTEITLSNRDIPIFSGNRFNVGTLGTIDADATDSHVYTLVAGEGDDDYSAFRIIDGNVLQTRDSTDVGQLPYSIRVRSEDGRGGAVEQQFTVSVTAEETFGILGAGAAIGFRGFLQHLNYERSDRDFRGEDLVETGFQASRDIPPALSWSLEAMGDLNGDGQDDILMRHANAGQYLVYYMDPNSNSVLPGNDGETDGDLFGRLVSDPNWEIVGAGDIDLDGNEDVILRNTIADQTIAWYLDGNGNILWEGLVGREIQDDSWRIDAVADFDGDGQSDFLLRDYDSGQNVLWKMDRGMIIEESLFGREITDIDWHIEGARDFNNDGITDVFLRHRVFAGDNLIWQMSDSQGIATEIDVRDSLSHRDQLVF